MNKTYYRVILPVAVRQIYTYAYDGSDDISYHRVKVQFGPKYYTGFTLTSMTAPTEGDYKPITEVIDAEPLLTPDLARLFDLINQEQFTFPYIILNTLLPPLLKLHKYRARLSREKKEERVILGQDGLKTKQEIERLRSKAPAQSLLLQVLLTYGGEFTRQELTKFSGKSGASLKELEQKGFIRFIKKNDKQDSIIAPANRQPVAVDLTDRQTAAAREIINCLEPSRFREFLLFGVTGSGKTEVYMAAIDEALRLGRSAIVLLPEISLTTQIWERFYQRYADQTVLYHSGLSDSHRLSIWKKIKSNAVRIVIGPRSALYAPFANLGLIVVDEEQSPSYKSNDNPRINTRDLALARGRLLDIPVVLGSATPSVDTFYRARQGRTTLLRLPDRINQMALPEIEIIDMRQEFIKQKAGIFSRVLTDRIGDTLKAEHQVIIFLNRRGYSRYLRCAACGHTVKCPRCDISLTLHGYGKQLLCHYCGLETETASACPACATGTLSDYGIGTEQLEMECLKRFPQHVTRRMDIDTMRDRDAYREILMSFANREIDILVGTQMITKGLDFPGVALVGIVDADTILNLPEYQSAESTFSQILQVAGRSGRGLVPGRVVVQTYKPEHYAIKMSGAHDYEAFYNNEIERREKLKYPPFYRLVRIIFSGDDADQVFEYSRTIRTRLTVPPPSVLNGPMECFLRKIKNQYRIHILLKLLPEHFQSLRDSLVQALAAKGRPRPVEVDIDIDPVSFL